LSKGGQKSAKPHRRLPGEQLTLDLGLDIVDSVGRLHLEGDSLPREGFDEDLHDLNGLAVSSLSYDATTERFVKSRSAVKGDVGGKTYLKTKHYLIVLSLY
jgi:hypothetical protein